MLRERTPIEIVFYAIYLLGLSLGQTSRALQALGSARSHEAVRQWLHRLAGRAEELVLNEKADTAIVDETAVNVAGRNAWLWIIIELEHKTILAVMLVEARNIFVAHSLFMDMHRRGVRHVIADGAPWYRLAAGWARLRHSVVRGGLHSYVERFIEAVKDRLMHRLLLPIA